MIDINNISFGYESGTEVLHNIDLHILTPSKWRASLGYKQGPKVKREELKQNAVNYIMSKYKIKANDDTAEAICIAEYGSSLKIE